MDDELTNKCYFDASFQIDKDDSRSQSKYVFVMSKEVVD